MSLWRKVTTWQYRMALTMATGFREMVRYLEICPALPPETIQRSESVYVNEVGYPPVGKT